MRDHTRRNQAKRVANHDGGDWLRAGPVEPLAADACEFATGGAAFATGNAERATIGFDEVFTCIGNPLFARGVLFERGESFGSEASAAITTSGVEECAEFQVKVARRDVAAASFALLHPAFDCEQPANLYDGFFYVRRNGFAAEIESMNCRGRNKVIGSCRVSSRLPRRRYSSLVLLLSAIVGCSSTPPATPPSPPETPWAEQVEAVRAGRSDRIVLLETAVDAAELRNLPADFPLRHLELPLTLLDDGGAEAVARLAALEVLVVGESPLTNIGLQSLARLRNLRRLNLPLVAADDAGAAALAQLPQLESLRLGGPKLTGATLKQLATAQPPLRFLILRNMPLGDADLESLASLTKLESLYLEGTQVTEAGAQRLERSRPHLHVHFP